MLSRDQAQPCRQLPAILESLAVANRGHQGTGRDRSDARNFRQLTTCFIFTMPLLDLSFKLIDLLVQFFKVPYQAHDELLETARQVVTAILDDLWHILGNMRNSHGNRNAILSQKPANLVRLRRSCLDESLASAVDAQLDFIHF